MTPPPPSALINPMARRLEAIGGPIRITHTEGVYLYDDTGRSWIDCETGSGLFSLGHRDAFAHGSLMKSLERFDLGNHHLISTERAELADTLTMSINCATGDAKRALQDPRYDGDGDLHIDEDGPQKVVFNTSSSECVDCAIKLARGATGKHTIICADNAYHGSTGYALAASAPALSANAPANIPGFVRVPFGSVDAVASAFASNRDVAAVMLESIAVEAGCILPPWKYLRQVQEICKSHKALLIVDESLTGLGRTGYHYVCTALPVCPDILIVGRAMCGGQYPLFATCHSDELDAFYMKNPFVHVSTFGGGEVGCDVGSTAVFVLINDKLLKSVLELGDAFRTKIEEAKQPLSSLSIDVRGWGLLNAVAFQDKETAMCVQRALFERGVFCRQALLAPECLLILPPLTITADENRAIIEAFFGAFAAAEALSS